MPKKAVSGSTVPAESGDSDLSDRRQIPTPVFRRLRVFAVDPGLTAQFSTAVMNEMTLSIPWEPLKPGPVGEYLEVIDRDENDKLLNAPVDLDNAALLGMDGYAPSDGNAQFRHQMVYAVAMRTIRNFERALGRPAQWPTRKGAKGKPVYTRRLEIRPHFYKQSNAHYDGYRGVFCFGYFVSQDDSPNPGTTVFTCLSQDVIAHELSHALLDGMNLEPYDQPGLDVGAFHEAFADLIALFQHFWISDVLRAQMSAICGDLNRLNSLGSVAPQFGQALGNPDGIRNAFGRTVEGVWTPRIADPKLYKTIKEPHERCEILVGAVFKAYKTIYESRIADLKRISTHGTGILPNGSLHPDLLERFTREASKVAESLLRMCIRALDYLPPANITFGDYLRAILTADYDLFPKDDQDFRVAFVEAFRSYGIVPTDISTLSLDTFLWNPPENAREVEPVMSFVRELNDHLSVWNLPQDREAQWKLFRQLREDFRLHLERVGKKVGPIDPRLPFKVQTFDLSWHSLSGGQVTAQWVIRLTQSPVKTSASKGTTQAKRKTPAQRAPSGCTLIIDAATEKVKYFVKSTPAHRESPLRNADVAMTRTAVAPKPSERRLRVFASDPTLGVQLETAGINEVTLNIQWERNLAGEDILQPGPIGEYLEVIDRDPASNCFYAPVNLNDKRLLAQNGHAPSESNPQFHQQMVYAVAMRTIKTFERALGRLALWSPRQYTLANGDMEEAFVQRLRIYPHALREGNAYYSPEKKAVLFGYFPSQEARSDSAPPLTIFTCLSHDIIAHEVTHALLDGMHRRFNESSNPDVLAFHEAFSDIVALFLHFSVPDVLLHQIAKTHGDLASQNGLGELAQQFGQALGGRGALRSAIGQVDENGKWKPIDPDPSAMSWQLEPHMRGAILVAATFDAFLTIYKARIADLLRIATEGTGVLPAGSLHPDLVNRMADEAASAAQGVLDMCIRALDYCPPVDLTFGDYLRALLTADFELDPVDAQNRRVAFVEAYRRHGIVPEDVRTLSVDGLLWRPTSAAPDEDEDVALDLVVKWANDTAAWGLTQSREDLYEKMKLKRAILHKYLNDKFKSGISLSGIDTTLKFEVHSIRPSMRSDWEGRPQFQWIVELTQRIPQYVDGNSKAAGGEPDYYFRGGCTLVIDASTGKLRYAIRKRLDKNREQKQRDYLTGLGNEALAATYFGGVGGDVHEPFAMLHRL